MAKSKNISDLLKENREKWVKVESAADELKHCLESGWVHHGNYGAETARLLVSLVDFLKPLYTYDVEKEMGDINAMIQKILKK